MKKEAKTDVGHWTSRSVKIEDACGGDDWNRNDCMDDGMQQKGTIDSDWADGVEQICGGFEMIGEETKKWRSSDEKCQWTRSEDWHGWGKQDRIVMVIIDREESEFKY